MSKQLTLRNTAADPLSEKQIVEATMAYANGVSVTLLDCVPESRGAISSSASTQQLLADAEISTPTDADMKKALKTMKASEKGGKPALEKFLEGARKELIRGHLGSIVSGEFDVEDQAKFLDNDEFFSSIRPRLYLKKNHEGNSVALYYTFADLFSLVRLGSFFLEDRQRPFGKELCQCQLESCAKFFFKIQPPKGAPQRKYCCSQHMTEAHNLNAAKRMEKHRSKPAKRHK